jgi:hypothetical protein
MATVDCCWCRLLLVDIILDAMGRSDTMANCDSIRTALDGLKREWDNPQQTLNAIKGGDPGSLASLGARDPAPTDDLRALRRP